MLNLPYWLEAAPLENPPAEPPRPAGDCDVAIIGAGFTGLAAALVLARAGRSVQVFDKAAPGEGASRRNGGIASGSLYFSLAGSIERFGEEKGIGMHREGLEARQALSRFLEEEKLEVGYRHSGRFDALNSPKHYDAKARECELYNKHLGIEARMVSRDRQQEELGTEFYYGGMVRPDMGQLHPGLLHEAMLKLAREAGARVLGHCAVESFEREGEGFRLKTAGGELRARDLIVGVNGYADKAASWARRRLVPVASQIIVTEPLSPNLMASLMPKGRAVGESRKLLNYYRPTPDGKRILFGGRAGALSDSAEEKARALKAMMTGIFPELRDTEVSHVWWGNVAYTFDYLPKLVERDGALYANGYCGSGVIWARWLGEKAAYRLLGDRERSRTWFSGEPFQTRPFYNGNPWFLAPLLTWYGLQDRRLP